MTTNSPAKYFFRKFKTCAALISCTGLLVFSSQNALAQCRDYNDIEGVALFVDESRNFNQFEGDVENINFSAFIGYNNPNSDREFRWGFGFPSILNDLDADPLLESSWRSLGHDFDAATDYVRLEYTDIRFTEDEIPEGGLGRFRAEMMWWDTCAARYDYKFARPLLYGYDAESLGLDRRGNELYTGIISDMDPKPHEVNSNAFLGLGRCKFDPTASGSNCPGTPVNNIANETRQYYNQVKIAPNGGGTQSISTGLSNLQAFHNRYFSEGKELVAEYYNDGDLGIGREMHCNFTAPGERACYVKNFAPCAVSTVGGAACPKPIFGDKDGAKAEQLADNTPFATVAMVERQEIHPTDEPDATFFAVYVCSSGDCSNLANHTLYDGPVALDNHGIAGTGSNTFNPGNCLVCHGSGGSYNAQTNQVFGAYFLPFDTSVFESLSSSLSPNDQHDVFREMNAHIATESHLKDVANARAIIEHWYVNSAGGTSFENGRFTQGDQSIPPGLGFSSGESSGIVYQQVYAEACRGCHITHPLLQFSTFNYWSILGPNLFKGLLCGDTLDSQGRPIYMPLAERTQEIVWEERVRENFFLHLGIEDISCDAFGG